MRLYICDIVGISALSVEGLLWIVLVPDSDLRVSLALSSMTVLAVLAILRLVHNGLGEQSRFHRFADWWICLSPMPIYTHLNGIMDALGRPVMDSTLIYLDQQILGGQASLWLSGHQHPLLSDVLFVTYASYYGWIALTGILLARRCRRSVFHAYLVAIASTFFLQMIGYVAVPAIGPRFAQADAFHSEIVGYFFAHRLDVFFRSVTFRRDCFPSGHTLQTLIAMFFSVVHLGKRYALVMCLAGSGIIVATLYCRMHYAVDLIAAVPFAVAGLLFAKVQRTVFFLGARPHFESRPASEL